MAQKHYSPVQVRNPTSLQHLATIRPGQGLELYLDHDLFPGEINLQLSSKHLVLENIDVTNPKRTRYTIEHDLFVYDWSEFSHSLLGEVWIDAHDRLAKVIVVMDSLNTDKMRTLTVCNPDCIDIRIKPHNIMEVVLCEQDFSGNDEWTWEWQPTLDLELEEIGYRNLNLYTWKQFASYDMDSPSFLYARHPRFEVGRDVQPWTKQHHFWFRFDKSILDIMGKDFGINRVGDLKFTGYSNRYRKQNTDISEYRMSVYVDLRSKFKERVSETLALKKETESVDTEPRKSYTTASSSGTTSIVHLKQRPKKQKHKRRYQQVLPLKREVAINKVPFGSLEDGCKVLSCSPEMDQIPDDDPYGHEDCDGYYHHSGLWKRLYRGAVHGMGRADHWD